MRGRNPIKKNTALRRKEKKQKTIYFKKMQQNEMNDKKRKNWNFYEIKVENKRRNFHHRLKKYFKEQLCTFLEINIYSPYKAPHKVPL